MSIVKVMGYDKDDLAGENVDAQKPSYTINSSNQSIATIDGDGNV